jgi:hypothetical protein
MVFMLQSYVANIIILLIENTILTKGHLGFNLLIQQDRLEFKQGGSSRSLAER